MQSDVVIKLSKEPHLEAALAESQRWFRDAWGTEPGFFAEANQFRVQGITSRTWWGDPKQLHVLYARLMLGHVIVIHIRGMKPDQELDDLLTMLDYLRCT